MPQTNARVLYNDPRSHISVQAVVLRSVYCLLHTSEQGNERRQMEQKEGKNLTTTLLSLFHGKKVNME